MGLQHYTQDMNKIPLKYNRNVLFYTKYTHPTLICRGTDTRTHGQTDAQNIFTQYSGISSFSLGSTDSTNSFNEPRELRGRSPSTPPAPTRPHTAALTFRVHPAAPTS
jgi:hypothetical protein